jgi:ferritin-like metal-binding protein YciE
MENMNQLRDLLKHELKDLHSAEEQIIEALPKMIEKANNKKLKQALQEHYKVTETQLERLDQALDMLDNDGEDSGNGFLSGLFKNSKEGEKCKAMEGLITEGEKLMKEDMSPDVSDAAIIASAQKIEHYEISSYGTVRAYAQELNLDEIEDLLKETLDEEYEADIRLTEIAESRVNPKAQGGSPSSKKRSTGRQRLQTTTPGRGRSTKSGKTSSNGRTKNSSPSRSKTNSRSSSRRKSTSR